jgi:tRNA-binding EMAP/Myf-like protein
LQPETESKLHQLISNAAAIITGEASNQPMPGLYFVLLQMAKNFGVNSEYMVLSVMTVSFLATLVLCMNWLSEFFVMKLK